MKRYVLSHIPMAVIYGLLIALVKGNWLPFEWSTFSSWMLFVVGVVIGVLMLFLDRIVYTYSYPNEQLSQTFDYYAKQKQWMRGLNLLDSRREEQNRLTFRSALFIAVWVPLSFFAITSTSALFGKGVVMGLMLHILSDAWRLQKISPERLSERLFWQIARPITQEERLVFMTIVSIVFVLFSFWIG